MAEKTYKAGSFVKGQSGNPAGRPKGARNKVTIAVMDYALEYTIEAVDTLVEIMRNRKNDPKVRVVAATSLLDRGLGRPETFANRYIESQVTRIDGGYRNCNDEA